MTNVKIEYTAVESAVVKFDAAAAGLAELQKKYGGVLYDCKTVEGMESARTARREVAKPRIAIEALRKEAKQPILELGRKLDAEAARITAAIDAIEKPIALQITTEEARQQREKDEAAAKELARVTAIRERIEKMRTAPQRAIAGGFSAEKFSEWIGKLEAIDVDDSFAEFRPEAEDAKAATLARLRELHAAAVEREAEAVKMEQQRQEQARIAEAQRAEQARLDTIRREHEATQAAETKRLADARAEQYRAAQAERDRQAEVRRQQEAEAARLAAERKRLADEAAERARIAALPLAPAPAPAPRVAPSAPIAPVKLERTPDAEQIVSALVEYFDTTSATALSWLKAIDWSKES